jgi:hypothetical protein
LLAVQRNVFSNSKIYLFRLFQKLNIDITINVGSILETVEVVLCKIRNFKICSSQPLNKYSQRPVKPQKWGAMKKRGFLHGSFMVLSFCTLITNTLFKPVLRSRSRINLVEPEPQCDTDQAPMALAANLMLNASVLSKMSQTVTAYYMSLW